MAANLHPSINRDWWDQRKQHQADEAAKALHWFHIRNPYTSEAEVASSAWAMADDDKTLCSGEDIMAALAANPGPLATILEGAAA